MSDKLNTKLEKLTGSGWRRKKAIRLRVFFFKKKIHVKVQKKRCGGAHHEPEAPINIPSLDKLTKEAWKQEVWQVEKVDFKVSWILVFVLEDRERNGCCRR